MNELKDKEDLQNEKLDMEKIVKEYTSFLNSVINNKVNSALSFEDKEEILTDAFFILWKNQEKLTTTIKAYLVGVVNNLIKEKFKKNKITYDFDEFQNSIDKLNNDSFEDLSKIEKIEEIIGELNEKDRKIIRLFYYEDKSVKEISKKVGLSESNIKIRLFRIRKTIKKKLKVGDK